MKAKNIAEKTKSPKKRVSTRVIAEVVGCAPCTVTQVQTGIRSPFSKTGQKIEVAQMLLEEGFENVIIKTKNTLNPQQ